MYHFITLIIGSVSFQMCSTFIVLVSLILMVICLNLVIS